jgi:glycosyltransferase involved in cell wall biosynthesis
MTETKDTISVITICFNNLSELIETCKSVDVQTSLPDEHLIIDGSSDRDISNWLQQTPQPSYRRWIHERDRGISDALNKGIKNSTGNIIHLLHSGDKYANADAIEEVKRHFAEDESLMWTHSLYIQNRGGIDVITGSPFSEELIWKGMRTVAHPTMFVKKELYDRYGLFDEKLKIAMDFDFLIRIRKEKFHFINKPLVYFAPGGASNVHFENGLREVRKSYERHLGKNVKLQLWQFRQRVLNSIMQTSPGKWLFKLKNSKKITS